MNEEEVVRFCIKHKITISQYYFMWMVLNKDEWTKPASESLPKQYLSHCGTFKNAEITLLVERGYVTDMNTGTRTEPTFFLVSDEIAKEMMVDEDMAEELWLSYPPEFQLSTGGSFLARAGGDKNEILKDYRKRIRNSPRKHKFVLARLEEYVTLVKEGRLNGRKIVDFVREEIWDTVADLTRKRVGTGSNDFIKDI